MHNLAERDQHVAVLVFTEDACGGIELTSA
jgi:hypothetical protein